MSSFAEQIAAASQQGRDLLERAFGQRNAIVIVGSGASVDCGYPSWDGLVNDMANKLTPRLDLRLSDRSKQLQLISNNCIRIPGQPDPVHEYIRSVFSPNGRTYKPLHRCIARLPFAGIATTNYDHVLEAAVSDELGKCAVTLNPCACKEMTAILEYRRALTSIQRARDTVLHLHGSYLDPENIVLTEDDYNWFYDGVVPPKNNNGRTTAKSLTHASILHSLMEAHTALFVGFSLNDVAFTRVMEALCREYGVVANHIHVAFAECSDFDDIDSTTAKWKRFGVAPIFYHVPEHDRRDHSALTGYFVDLLNSFAVPRDTLPTLEDFESTAMRYF